MPVLRKTRKNKVILAVTGAIGVVLVTAYVHHLKSVPTLQQASAPVQTDDQSVDQTDQEESPVIEELPLGSLLGHNQPAVPPIIMYVGRPPGEADSPDLSTPAAAVYSVLSLIKQSETDKLAGCFVGQIKEPASNLYPRYLGHPVELVEVNEEDDNAEVIWSATVNAVFSLDSKNWSPGETMLLKAILVRVEGLWKLSKLHDRGKDGP